jgi:hypothetical protein
MSLPLPTNSELNLSGTRETLHFPASARALVLSSRVFSTPGVQSAMFACNSCEEQLSSSGLRLRPQERLFFLQKFLDALSHDRLTPGMIVFEFPFPAVADMPFFVYQIHRRPPLL